jgi:hypothetical protein
MSLKEERAPRNQWCGYTALGGVGEWIVGSLRYLQLVGTVFAGTSFAGLTRLLSEVSAVILSRC